MTDKKLTRNQWLGIAAILIVAALIGSGLFSITTLGSIGSLDTYHTGETVSWVVHLSPADGRTLVNNYDCKATSYPYTSLTITAQSYLVCNKASGQAVKLAASPALTAKASCNYFASNSGYTDFGNINGLTTSAVIPTDATSCKITVTYSTSYKGVSATVEDSSPYQLRIQGLTYTDPKTNVSTVFTTFQCTPGQKQCFGSQPKTCDANGVYQQSAVCIAGCTNGACVKQCNPGQTQCNPNNNQQMQTCDSSGQYTKISYAPSPQSQYYCQNGQWVHIVNTVPAVAPTQTQACPALALPSGQLEAQVNNYINNYGVYSGAVMSYNDALVKFRQQYPTDADVCKNLANDYQIVTVNGCPVCQVRDWSNFETCSDGSRRPIGTCPTATTTEPGTAAAAPPSQPANASQDLGQQVQDFLSGAKKCYTQDNESIEVGVCTADKTLRCTQTQNGSMLFQQDSTCVTNPGALSTAAGASTGAQAPDIKVVAALVLVLGAGYYYFAIYNKKGRKK